VSIVELTETFLPHLSGIQVDQVQLKGAVVRVQAQTVAATTACPGCGSASRRVHSRYWRRLSDQAISGREVLIDVRVRRFFCGNPACDKKIFAEPLPNLAGRYARRTRQAGQLLTSVGLALGGRAGARLTTVLATPVNRMTMIRVVRQVPDPPAATPTVLGVDDFAIRRGHRYATILIDMHTHRPIDMLPDRDAETLANWLRTHPGVAMICRDRGSSYAEGANRALPGVPQVADRWHLLHNLSGHVEKAVARHRRCLRPPEPAPPAPRPPAARPPSRRETNTRTRWQQIHDLKSQGLGPHIIARRLGLDPKTVHRYADVASPQDLLGPSATGRHGVLNPHKPYLQARIDEGVTATSLLLQEITARGYRGGERTLRRWLIDARQQKPPAPPPPPTSRTITGWIMRPAEKLNEDDTAALKQAHSRCLDIAAITELAHGFTYLVRERAGTQLEDWIEHAAASAYPEIRAFANGLRKDFDAVRAGLTLTWSSGAVEGQVNRIKMLKRQMFGRANLDLLRKRILVRDHPQASITT
jgi:transposase